MQIAEDLREYILKGGQRPGRDTVQAQKEGTTVHFATLTELCHLNNSELEPQFQNAKMSYSEAMP